MMLKKQDQSEEEKCHGDILDTVHGLADGSPIPKQGACLYLYHTVEYPGQTIHIYDGTRHAFFHFENDDVMQDMLSATPIIHVDTEGDIVTLSILFKTGANLNRIPLTFNAGVQASAKILEWLIRTERIELTLVNFIHGMMVKETSISLPLPEEILAEIKKAVV